MVDFSFFVQGQLANFNGFTQTVNWISVNSLALMMPTGFFAGIQASPQKIFPQQAGSRENFTPCA
jgi:hypothetical protein